ncbi:MAG: inner-rane translocator [Solirubrobacterales bacterium]|nr:inner-rane translocator [Solirubrobacterales bacterium]
MTKVFRRLAEGDLGVVRVILVIALIWIYFQANNSHFLTAVNLTNLTLQTAGLGMISVGVVLVLLLGEIDLSVGAVSGLAGAVVAVLNVKHGWAAAPAILAGIAVGAAIGGAQGAIFAKIGVPSFVVTLAGLLAWQGMLLVVLGKTGTVNITDPGIVDLANKFFSHAIGWIVAVGVVAAYAASNLSRRRRRQAANLPVPSLVAVAVRIGLVAAVTFAAILVFNADRGLPLAVVILLGFVIVFDAITLRTVWGRHIFAVGGNAEAARRAGIKVDRIRIGVFALASALAGCGGILLASRLLAVNQSSGGSDTLLLAIAGPVIAGTSLFGGRGSIWSAVLGAVVIGSITNGIDLLSYPSSTRLLVTGAVLLAAVIIDALTSKRRRAVGR